MFFAGTSPSEPMPSTSRFGERPGTDRTCLLAAGSRDHRDEPICLIHSDAHLGQLVLSPLTGRRACSIGVHPARAAGHGTSATSSSRPSTSATAAAASRPRSARSLPRPASRLTALTRRHSTRRGWPTANGTPTGLLLGGGPIPTASDAINVAWMSRHVATAEDLNMAAGGVMRDPKTRDLVPFPRRGGRRGTAQICAIA